MLTAIILGALAIGLAGASYGAFHHVRFVQGGGQHGFRVTPVVELSQGARASYRAMLIGYGLFMGGLAIAIFVSAVWGHGGT